MEPADITGSSGTQAVRQYAFFVDSNACSGCKTCQVACKDRHDLPAGLHFRRVFEVTAGGWQKKGDAWESNVVAYYLSAACHHCFVPVCASSCPTDAIWKTAGGVVVIDESACTGCCKCEVDCPYRAIRWDVRSGVVRKCDFCLSDLLSGSPPACVSSCPNRALSYGEYDDLKEKFAGVQSVFPLPDPSLAEPALVIRAHRRASLAAGLQPEVANAEEI
jgi:anaerobic dimethyl sulfoxide reductase subunit B